MSLKTEKTIDTAVNHANASKWDKLKRFGRKALLATVSTISIATGMLGTSQQMQAQAPRDYVTVSADNLDAYLNGNRNSATTSRQQQYSKVYANRDAYRQQQQTYRAPEYASPEWLAERGYEYDARLSMGIDHTKYIGAFLDYSQTDRYGMPRNVVFLPHDPVHDSIQRMNVKAAAESQEIVAKGGIGDSFGIYSHRFYNGEGTGGYSYGGRHYHPRTRTGEKIRGAIQIIDGVARIVRSGR